MRRCYKCLSEYPDDGVVRCIHCDTLLVAVDENELAYFKRDEPEAGNSLVNRNRRIGDHGHMLYILGSFFKNRTFVFSYSLSRNDMKLGKGYQRLLVQPLNFSVLFKIPWIFINILDSFLFRFIYEDCCEKCNYKIRSRKEHSNESCEYNQEYFRIILEVLSGRIGFTEKAIQEKALEKIAAGRRSAYYDLRFRKALFERVMDAVCVVISVGIIFGLIVYLLFPMVKILFMRAEGMI